MVINHDDGHKVPQLIDEKMEQFISFINKEYNKKFGENITISSSIDENFRNEFKAQKLNDKSMVSKV